MALESNFEKTESECRLFLCALSSYLNVVHTASCRHPKEFFCRHRATLYIFIFNVISDFILRFTLIFVFTSICLTNTITIIELCKLCVNSTFGEWYTFLLVANIALFCCCLWYNTCGKILCLFFRVCLIGWHSGVPTEVQENCHFDNFNCPQSSPTILSGKHQATAVKLERWQLSTDQHWQIFTPSLLPVSALDTSHCASRRLTNPCHPPITPSHCPHPPIICRNVPSTCNCTSIYLHFPPILPNWWWTGSVMISRIGICTN